MNVPIESILKLEDAQFQLDIRREDLIHPQISGNKFRKLKYNLKRAKEEGFNTILTFGGAYSNHIAATAYAGNHFGFKTIGVIRGEELALKVDTNPTLKLAQKWDMKLVFETRANYKLKHTEAYLDRLKQHFPEAYIVPEGGTNELAVRGCEEILGEKDIKYDYICCAVGTGGTISGLIRAAKPHQQVIGFSSLKGQGLREDISKFVHYDHWQLITQYHFGGYAKINDELVSFINGFKDQYKVPLDPIYTGKMMYGILDLIETGFFPKNSKILAIHTGGLQGIRGINNKLRFQKKPLINE